MKKELLMKLVSSVHLLLYRMHGLQMCVGGQMFQYIIRTIYYYYNKTHNSLIYLVDREL